MANMSLVAAIDFVFVKVRALLQHGGHGRLLLIARHTDHPASASWERRPQFIHAARDATMVRPFVRRFKKN